MNSKKVGEDYEVEAGSSNLEAESRDSFRLCYFHGWILQFDHHCHIAHAVLSLNSSL